MKRTIKVSAVYDLSDPEFEGMEVTPKEVAERMVREEMEYVFGGDDGLAGIEVEVIDTPDITLQYRYFETSPFKYEILLYHNGQLVETYKAWLDDMDDKIDELERHGYTCGYTAKQVNEAKERYERMLANILIGKETEL